MLQAVTSGITTVISWIGSVISAVTTETGGLHELLPLFAVGIAISAILLGKSFLPSLNSVKTVKAEMLMPC